MSIRDRLAAYDEVLYGVRGGFGRDDAVTRAEFHQLIAQLDVNARYPGVQVIGAAHLIDPGDLASVETTTNRDLAESGVGYPDFAVHPRPSSAALAIDYVEPVRGNEKAFGFDFFSETNRREAAERARDTGLAATTAPVTLVQETGSQRAFLTMLPIYRPGAPTDTIEQRRAAFTGVVYAAFRMGDLMAGILGEAAPSTLLVADVGADQLIVGDESDSAQLAAAANDGRFATIEVSGRTWRIFVDDDAPVLSFVERQVPLVTFFGGLFITGLLVALIGSMRSAQSRALLLASEMTDELEALTESASEAIVSVDADGVIVAWNRGATDIFGLAGEDAIGRPINERVPARDRARFDAALKAVITGSHSRPLGRSLQLVGCRASGDEFPVEMSLSRWSARGQQFVTGFVRDVADRVEAEARLRETTGMLIGVLGAATKVSIIGIDRDGTIRVFNAGAERMLGYEAAELIGHRTIEMLHDPDEIFMRASQMGIEPGFDVFVSAARRGVAETRQWTYVRRDGDRVPVELTVTPRYDDAGRLCGFIAVAFDIASRLAAAEGQQQLLDREREMVVKLTEIDRVKSDFVSTMSHELRTPLTSIVGYAELLCDDLGDDNTSQQFEMVSMIDKNSKRLLLLVEDLLTLSRIESGSLHANREPCDTGQILRSACDAIGPLAASRNISVDLNLAAIPTIEGDSPQLERVFLNLLVNAVKFSHAEGTVEVDAAIDPSTQQLVVSITDHGIGIPADEQEHLFSRFFRSRTAEKHAIQGTGLGLAIVRNIVDRHDGNIEIHSQEDVGTRVVVTLPIESADSVNHDLAGQDMPGEQMPGEQMPGDQMPGEQMPGEQMPGEQMRGVA